LAKDAAAMTPKALIKEVVESSFGKKCRARMGARNP